LKKAGPELTDSLMSSTKLRMKCRPLDAHILIKQLEPSRIVQLLK